MLGFQLLAFIVILAIVSKIFASYRKREISFRLLLIWIVFWFLALLFIWRPNISSEMAVLLGIGRGTDLVVYFSIIFLFYSLYRIMLRMDRLDRNVTDLVRHIAVHNPVAKPKDEDSHN
ncbi:MAG: hypothetical protein G01um101418_97 [Parcubacteria group bacterium Gr01-1014_18]|nr:MAG: hypothetical protein Greene041636_401 [Parcubacteria group bacterium Greene0416_36]TSC81424.1 MAG: hypothetical protein G01um101418_97 [Parcubacteria group bacterium Gr01-1014_18]TSC99022.1 MAG: hypothetical protein Greene101420_378 [Parcubacteria group bacterium Greene1014_20]TSD07297.1 MAG: hypothetical protein Greene07142_313 [Parcubacteria group bacterium Greene0714_2]